MLSLQDAGLILRLDPMYDFCYSTRSECCLKLLGTYNYVVLIALLPLQREGPGTG